MLNIFKIEVKKIKRINFRNDINGLRAIAVLSVIFYHAEYTFIPGGWLGVDVFFVISGFLISNIIISELNSGEFQLKNFYIRRVKRIIPALFATILVSIPASMFLHTPKMLLEFSKSIQASMFFYSNYYFKNLDFYNAEPTKEMPLLHTWSLAIEEQFYIVFPLLCYLVFKKNRKHLPLIFVFIFLLSIFLNSTTETTEKFYLLQFRIWELLLGAITMVIRSKITFRHTEKIGIIMLLYSFLYFDDSMITLNSIEPKVLSNFGTALILLSNEKSYINNFLSNKAFKVVGLTSYSLYLFHQPLFAFEKIFLEKYSISNSDFFKFSIFVVLFLFSYFNWKYIEVYFQKVEFKVLIKSIVILILIFVIFIYASSYTNGFENRFSFVPEEVLYYATNPNIYPNTFESTDYVFQNVNCENYILSNKYCIYFNTFNDKTIYLIGDSQTNSLSVSFLQEFKEISNTYNLVFFSGPAGRCILSMQSDTLGYVPECSEEFFNAFTDILNKNSDLVIAFGRFDTWLTNKGNNELKCTECSHIETFRSRIEKISQNSHRFYLIEPIPTYKFGIANSYLYKKTKWGEAITQDIKTRDQQLLLTNSFIETIGVKNLSYISTTPLFCDKNYCYASSVDQIYYSDTNHLTLEGALKISELLKTIISKLE